MGNINLKGVIPTKIGNFSKEKFNALVNVRSCALESICKSLRERDYAQVTTSTLVNIAGSCENPNASFTLDYYGREAHLSQSAQIQLEKLVITLERGVFTVNNSFREENYDDPQAKGRRLSEFTLIEPERPYGGMRPAAILSKIINEEREVLGNVIRDVLRSAERDVRLLGGKPGYLGSAAETRWEIITYDDALKILNENGGNYSFGIDLGVLEERRILEYFNNFPVFVTNYPAAIKFFNMRRATDGNRVYSVDLLAPRLGETSGGAVREEDSLKIKENLLKSKVGKYLIGKKRDPLEEFGEYFESFEGGKAISRGGYGIGFERLVGFLLDSNDILHTIAHRILEPGEKRGM